MQHTISPKEKATTSPDGMATSPPPPATLISTFTITRLTKPYFESGVSTPGEIVRKGNGAPIFGQSGLKLQFDTEGPDGSLAKLGYSFVFAELHPNEAEEVYEDHFLQLIARCREENGDSGIMIDLCTPLVKGYGGVFGPRVKEWIERCELVKRTHGNRVYYPALRQGQSWFERLLGGLGWR
ncbi:hypothetical protein BJ508DRAFT_330441 [Ascobolus immersus RN42]|uniref:Uncharacterized protein n=1 Tax=Ascobolus immersus RN42 TaxID=1160509 RepID=A0A3N4HX94_ASCIM|nr:hypothetical protein BJ508DRAFT_330441 [Ascobolus immersus RN42]